MTKAKDRDRKRVRIKEEEKNWKRVLRGSSREKK